MKNLLLATAAVLSFSATHANAETFNGPFIGIDIAYDHAEGQTNVGEDSEYKDDSSSYSYQYRFKEDGQSLNGLAGGIFVGYDARLGGKFFAGVEARVGLSAAKASVHESEKYEYSDSVNPDYDESEDYNYSSTIRAKESFSATARLGYLLNEKTGLYVRGGVVQTRFKINDSSGFELAVEGDEDTPTIYNFKDTNTGFTYGAGLETSISSKTSLRVEYNITQYGSVFNKLNRLISEEGEFSKTSISNHQVRLALSQSF